MSRLAFLALVIALNTALFIAASGCLTVSCFDNFKQQWSHK